MRTNYPRILVLSLLVTAFLFSATAQLPAQQVQAQRKSKLLFVTQCKGFRHAVLHQAEEIMEQIGAKNGFDVTITQMAEKYITPATLKSYDVIVFYTTGELPLSDVQKKALLDWIKSGKFFYGIHSATDTYYKWPEYGQMIGGYFNKHPWTQETQVTIKTEDKSHPVSRHLPDGWSIRRRDLPDQRLHRTRQNARAGQPGSNQNGHDQARRRSQRLSVGVVARLRQRQGDVQRDGPPPRCVGDGVVSDDDNQRPQMGHRTNEITSDKRLNTIQASLKQFSLNLKGLSRLTWNRALLLSPTPNTIQAFFILLPCCNCNHAFNQDSANFSLLILTTLVGKIACICHSALIISYLSR
ncbi:MAG: ThuA domain-containing protein [Acidobacteriota bacterium]